jgi:tetratricopeptide (TPR) repeat protein
MAEEQTQDEEPIDPLAEEMLRILDGAEDESQERPADAGGDDGEPSILSKEEIADLLARATRGAGDEDEPGMEWQIGPRRIDESDDEILRACNEALAAAPDDFAAWLRKGQRLFELFWLDSGWEAFTRATELRPDSPEAWTGRGQAQLRGGQIAGDRADYEGALSCFDRALALSDAADSLCGKAHAHWLLGQAHAAVAAYRRGFESGAGNAEDHYVCACALVASGHAPAAIEQLARAFELDERLREAAADDELLAPLRHESGFQSLL